MSDLLRVRTVLPDEYKHQPYHLSFVFIPEPGSSFHFYGDEPHFHGPDPDVLLKDRARLAKAARRSSGLIAITGEDKQEHKKVYVVESAADLFSPEQIRHSVDERVREVGLSTMQNNPDGRFLLVRLCHVTNERKEVESSQTLWAAVPTDSGNNEIWDKTGLVLWRTGEEWKPPSSPRPDHGSKVYRIKTPDKSLWHVDPQAENGGALRVIKGVFSTKDALDRYLEEGPVRTDRKRLCLTGKQRDFTGH